MIQALRERAQKMARSLKGMEPEEAAVLALLQRRLASEKGARGLPR